MKLAVNYSCYANLSWHDDAGGEGGHDAAPAHGHESLADPSHDGLKLALRAIWAHRAQFGSAVGCVRVSRL